MHLGGQTMAYAQYATTATSHQLVSHLRILQRQLHPIQLLRFMASQTQHFQGKLEEFKRSNKYGATSVPEQRSNNLGRSPSVRHTESQSSRII